MGKLEGKVAVITGGSSGMALASAKRFVEEGAYVFITGRRQEALDEAVKLIGRNVTGVRGDAANLDDLDRLFDTVKREKGKIDVLFASAGKGEAAPLGEITEQHFDAAFDLNVRGTLFTVQKALPLFNVFVDITNRLVWYRCRRVRTWGSRPSRRPGPVLACRHTPGRSSICHFER